MDIPLRPLSAGATPLALPRPIDTLGDMAATRRPDPPPLRVNEFMPVIGGTVSWAIALVVLATQHHDMAARGQGWWLWVALTGFGLGLWGLFLLWLRHRGLRRRAAAAPSTAVASAAPETSAD